MSDTLRGYQSQMQQDVYAAWNAGAQYVMMCMGTGCGKTVTGMSMVPSLPGVGVVQAHRAELVGQLSMSLAKQGVRHDITASTSVRKAIVEEQIEELGRSFYDPQAPWSVESVDTAIRRNPRAPANWVITDEGHHVVKGNKWYRAIVEKHPQARGLLMTATPCRADGKGLGAHTDGIVNKLVIGPGLGHAMANGYLVEYDIKAARASDLNMDDVSIGANGEFNQEQASRAVRRSTKIIGDAVKMYREFAWGKLNLLFAVDIGHARDLLKAFIDAGIPTELVTGDDLDHVRRSTLKRFILRQTWVVINVDLFGEGTDIPGVEVVQMCRPTASFPLFAQQVGRMMRLAITRDLHLIWESLTVEQRKQFIAQSAKPRGLLIDHVGNIHQKFKIGDTEYSGPPEGFTDFDLERRGKRAGGGGGSIPQRICQGCYLPYERIHDACPYCGTSAPPPDDRSSVAHVDGNLYDYDPDLLASIRANIARIDGPPLLPESLEGVAAAGARKQWIERQRAQQELRTAIAYWAGKHAGDTDSVNYKRFYHTFGIDVPTALTLNTRAATDLKGRIDNVLFGSA